MLLLKFVVLISLIPLALALFVGRGLGRKRIDQLSEISVKKNAESVLRHLLGDDPEPKLTVRSRVWGAPLDSTGIKITRAEAEDQSAAAVGRMVWIAGLAEIEASSPDVLKWWRGARVFGTIGIPMVWMILAFGLVAMRIPAMAVIYSAISVVGIASILCLIQLASQRMAARYGIGRLEQSKLFHRLDDEELVAQAAKAWAYNEAIPVCINLLWRKSAKKVEERMRLDS